MRSLEEIFKGRNEITVSVSQVKDSGSGEIILYSFQEGFNDVPEFLYGKYSIVSRTWSEVYLVRVGYESV